MAFTSPYVYCRAEGEFRVNSSPVDIFQVGWKIPLGSPPSQGTLVAFLETISAPVSSFHSNADLRAGSAAVLTALTAAYVGTDGKYVGGGTQQTTRRVYTTPVPGNSTTNAPFTQALVMSLRTPIARGRGSNGRLYWPATALLMGDTGVLSTVVTAAIAGRAKTLLDNINAACATIFGTPARVSVMSSLDSGVTAPVTHVRVGTKVDRQERRESAFPEEYSTVALASTAALVEQQLDRIIGSG